MIVTVTMNPAVDKMVEIETLISGELNRITKVEYDAGGKGINVSKAIHELGGKSIATGFLGGNNGRAIAGFLENSGIENDFIWTDGETRTNTKILERNGTVTELNEPGAAVTEKQMKALMEKILNYAGSDTLFVLSGSRPGGVPADIYAQIIRAVHEKQGKVLLDTDGESLRLGIEEKPDIIKPNITELAEYAQIKEEVSEKKILQILEQLKNGGIETIALSMGKSGAFFLLGDNILKCPSLSVKAHSTVGAGDAMVAGLACSWERKLTEEETVRLCMAVSAGAVMTTGTRPPEKELVNMLEKKVRIIRLK